MSQSIKIKISKAITIFLIAILLLFPAYTVNAASTSSDFANLVLSLVPEYNGSPFIALNGNIPLFTANEITTNNFELYSELDEYGRCGVAFANICKVTMPTAERGEIGMIKPSGWQTVKYNGYIEGNYLYNRCHLIGYQLAGENANVKNLITGTRYLNVIGMLPFENMVANYIYKNPNNHVLYRVTPIFKDNNLVASGVLMEAYSVEDAGKGIQFCVYCYNVQPNIYIDYSNGKSILVTDSNNSANVVIPTPTISNQNITQLDSVNVTEIYYIGNKRNGKLHKSTCKNPPALKNQAKYTTKEEAMAAGYKDFCGNCNP